MSVIIDNFKVFKPFFPTLTQITLFQVTFPIYKTFGKNLLGKAIEDIQEEESSDSNESRQENYDENYKRAKEIVKKIPTRLRRKVYDSSVSLFYQEYDWIHDHPRFRNVKCVFHWKCFGTIDRIKTAEQFIRNENNDIRKRFEMASMYCFTESVKTLWANMVASGDEEHLDAADKSVVGFWVRWLLGRSRVPWTQALLELNPDSHEVFDSVRSYSSFFPLLQPEKRLEFLLVFSKYASFEDFRMLLYSLTKSEEYLLLEKDPVRIIKQYWEWPLRSLFLETAERVIKYMDGKAYKEMVEYVVESTENHWFVDDIQLFQGLWEMSPTNLKEVVIADQILYVKIDSYFFSEIRKRKSEFDELTNGKRKMINKN